MKKILFLFALSALMLASCRGGGRDDIFQISDPARQLEAAAGSEFKIVIESNPTTGYHWELMEELDGSIVEFVSKDYRPDEPVTTGSGGVDVWIFKAIAAGEAQIVLGYYPPSLGEEAEQVVTFSLIVK